MLKKKLIAGVATLALALGIVAVTASSASAHHNTITATVSCSTDYKYQINWSVKNSESDKTETITASNRAVVAVGATLAQIETKVFSEVVSTTDALTLTLSAEWSNGYKNTNSGTLASTSFPDCIPPDAKVTLCHATPPADAKNGWNAISVAADGAAGGHDGDALDIIPAFTYWAKVAGVWTQLNYPGKNLGTNFSGFTGAQVLAGNCAPSVTATAPTFAPAVCVSAGVVGTGSYTIPTTTGVQYSVRLGNTGSYANVSEGTVQIAVGTIVEVKATALPTWVALTGTAYWTYTVASPGDCIFIVAPVTPTVVAISACGTYGTLTIPTTTGVIYTLTEGDGKQGTWQVTATPEPGYKFAGPQTVKFGSDLGKYVDCPVEPTVKNIIECGVPGSVVFATSVGVVYTLTSGSGTYGLWEATATPAPGYVFYGPQIVNYSGDLGKYTDCVTPKKVTFTNSVCELGGPKGGTFTIPEIEGVQYSVNTGAGFLDQGKGTYPAKDGDVVAVQAHAKPGFTLKGVTEWTHTFEKLGVCDLTTLGLAVPSYSTTPITCSAAGSYTVGAEINGEFVVWTIAGSNTPIPFGTHPVTSTQNITLVATSTDPIRHGLATLDSKPWVNPPTLSFVSPAKILCGDLPTLALTGGGAGAALGLAGALLLLGFGGLLITVRRRNAS